MSNVKVVIVRVNTPNNRWNVVCYSASKLGTRSAVPETLGMLYESITFPPYVKCPKVMVPFHTIQNLIEPCGDEGSQAAIPIYDQVGTT